MQLCPFHHNSSNCHVPDLSLTKYFHFQIDVTKNLCSGKLWFSGVILPFNSTTYLQTLTSNAIWVNWFFIPIWLATNYLYQFQQGLWIKKSQQLLKLWWPLYNIPLLDIISCIVSGKKNLCKQSRSGQSPIFPESCFWGVRIIMQFPVNNTKVLKRNQIFPDMWCKHFWC